MKIRLNKKVAIVIVAVLVVLLIVLACAIPSCGRKLDYNVTFYYVCYDSPSDVHSASSVSNVVHSYGGAGYIIKDGGEYFVTVSCYYKESDAVTVCENLNRKGLKCTVRKVEAGDYELRGAAAKNSEKYLGNLDTLTSLATVCYNLSNSLDDCTYGQNEAKSLLSNVKDGLRALLRDNPNNCFTDEIKRLIAECDDVSDGYVFSHDVRRLQIAFTDTVVNIKLY